MMDATTRLHKVDKNDDYSKGKAERIVGKVDVQANSKIVFSRMPNPQLH